jgi:hypothetical protein
MYLFLNNLLELHSPLCCGSLSQLVPLDGSPPIPFTIPDYKLHYTHFINSFERPESIVFDIITYKTNMFQAFMSVQDNRNATTRNTLGKDLLSVITRFEVFVAGPRQNTTTMTDLISPRQTDFPRINDKYAGQAYCFFYAVEWYYFPSPPPPPPPPPPVCERVVIILFYLMYFFHQFHEF